MKQDSATGDAGKARGWQQIGLYQYEFNQSGYTGWYRCVGGRLASGLWPMWNYETGEQR